MPHLPLSRVARGTPPVAPPGLLRHGPEGVFGLRRWWARTWAQVRDGSHRLAAARREFDEALCGVPPAAVADLPRRIAQARTLHELWHLRSQVYSLVARHLSQADAEERLDELNRHFDAPRQGKGPR